MALTLANGVHEDATSESAPHFCEVLVAADPLTSRFDAECSLADLHGTIDRLLRLISETNSSRFICLKGLVNDLQLFSEEDSRMKLLESELRKVDSLVVDTIFNGHLSLREELLTSSTRATNSHNDTNLIHGPPRALGQLLQDFGFLWTRLQLGPDSVYVADERQKEAYMEFQKARSLHMRTWTPSERILPPCCYTPTVLHWYEAEMLKRMAQDVSQSYREGDFEDPHKQVNKSLWLNVRSILLAFLLFFCLLIVILFAGLEIQGKGSTIASMSAVIVSAAVGFTVAICLTFLASNSKIRRTYCLPPPRRKASMTPLADQFGAMSRPSKFIVDGEFVESLDRFMNSGQFSMMSHRTREDFKGMLLAEKRRSGRPFAEVYDYVSIHNSTNFTWLPWLEVHFKVDCLLCELGSELGAEIEAFLTAKGYRSQACSLAEAQDAISPNRNVVDAVFTKSNAQLQALKRKRPIVYPDTLMVVVGSEAELRNTRTGTFGLQSNFSNWSDLEVRLEFLRSLRSKLEPIDDQKSYDKKGGCIGTGSSSSVFIGELNTEPKLIAVKCLHPKNTTEIQSPLLREIEASGELRHSNIVEYYCSRSNSNSVEIWMELCETSLENKIKQFADAMYVLGETELVASEKLLEVGVPPISIFKGYLRDVLRGLDHIHRKRWAHRDVKPGNILIKSGSAKICDFGSACRQTDTSDKAVGTSQFMAPESFRKDLSPKFTKEDIWAFGITVLEMFQCIPKEIEKCGNSLTCISGLFSDENGKKGFTFDCWPRPFSKMRRDKRDLQPGRSLFPSGCQSLSSGSQLFQSVKAFEKEIVSEQSNLASFVRSCLEWNPEKRPTASDLLKHPFLLEDRNKI